jgi:membrane-associated phospholipid phosphatase
MAIFAFTVLIVFADLPIAEFCRDSGLAEWIDRGFWAKLFRFPGEYVLTLTSALALLIFHRLHWRAAGLVVLSGVPGAINGLLKWVAGRSRPFKWGQPWEWDFFRDGWHGLTHQKDLGFASGHTTQAFAWATAMAICMPSLRWFFYAWATLCGLQRMASTDHYLTDVLVGAALGTVTVRLLFRILSRLVPPPTDGRAAEMSEQQRPRAELDADER